MPNKAADELRAAVGNISSSLHADDLLHFAIAEIDRMHALQDAHAEQVELLQAEIARLNDYLRHVEAERDAALRRALSH